MQETKSPNPLEPASTAAKKPYAVFDPGPLTCQTDIEGLAFDFNYGARIKVPAGDWRVKITDRDCFNTLYDAKASDVLVTSTKKYYVNFRLEIYREEKLIFSHDFTPARKRILIKFPVGTLGDIIAWFPYAQVFRYQHNCEVYCAIAPELAELFKPTYPELHFIGPDERPDNVYASYYMGIFFPCDDRMHQPVDWRIVGLQKTIPYILGLRPEEIRPQIAPRNPERSIAEPYVCIAAQATSQAKYWNNPAGWLNIIKHLKAKGYRVLCIDQKDCHGSGSRWNTIPYGAEDFTGNLPLSERVDLLYHADFFIGLSSGLSWLAWAVGRPVVLISGFSLPLTEFHTPYRIINYHVCNGCWTDSAIEFEHNDFAWCPRHKNTDRQFECTRFITPEQVGSVIDQLMYDYKLNPRREGKNLC
ncbi:autotransporter strand-loop-strand O-heptosyltransferase [Sporomusa sphaeroides]|uniref:autotransporter strand-loop-strand O-heptosyltransferase n=1 Tax=Sporomusa sphaeroides TaxID=47679 RepID=UPI002C5103C9|nr:autotransporter strand-loop-strand O-heptosyltransferase [Sporomusa sphaeroides]HML33947.1 autotransporter strand-loop-strand O-heptosyltransferase [Sporomusa sphaeroides]